MYGATGNNPPPQQVVGQPIIVSGPGPKGGPQAPIPANPGEQQQQTGSPLPSLRDLGHRRIPIPTGDEHNHETVLVLTPEGFEVHTRRNVLCCNMFSYRRRFSAPWSSLKNWEEYEDYSCVRACHPCGVSSGEKYFKADGTSSSLEVRATYKWTFFGMCEQVVVGPELVDSVGNQVRSYIEAYNRGKLRIN